MSTLLPLPAKLYFTISEAAEWCRVEPHVLRYWEQVFAELKPPKHHKRRMYRKEDILIAQHIRELLYDRGFTLSGAKRELKREKRSASPPAPVSKVVLKDIIAELKALLSQDRVV